MSRALADQARTIRMPVHAVERYNKVLRATRQLVQDLGREPTHAEIADRLSMSASDVSKAFEMYRGKVDNSLKIIMDL